MLNSIWHEIDSRGPIPVLEDSGKILAQHGSGGMRRYLRGKEPDRVKVLRGQ